MNSDLLIFQLILPLDLAPMLNVYKRLSIGKEARLKKDIDAYILKAKTEWPNCIQNLICKPILTTRNKKTFARMKVVGGGEKRAVHITRYSSKEPDEISADVIGGKIPIDKLVEHHILRDDSDKWLSRQASWIYAAPSASKLIINLYRLPPTA